LNEFVFNPNIAFLFLTSISWCLASVLFSFQWAPLREQLVYITTLSTACQYLFSSFFDFAVSVGAWPLRLSARLL